MLVFNIFCNPFGCLAELFVYPGKPSFFSRHVVELLSLHFLFYPGEFRLADVAVAIDVGTYLHLFELWCADAGDGVVNGGIAEIPYLVASRADVVVVGGYSVGILIEGDAANIVAVGESAVDEEREGAVYGASTHMEVVGHHGQYLVGTVVPLGRDDDIHDCISLGGLAHALFCHVAREDVVGCVECFHCTGEVCFGSAGGSGIGTCVSHYGTKLQLLLYYPKQSRIFFTFRALSSPKEA